MKRPTISLAMIVKNEEHNLPRLFKSIEGCFDEIHITDTGSSDNTVEVAKALGATVHHFKWCDDFSAARNASFKPITTDFVMWMDGDDVLSDKDAFIKWRDSAMGGADLWLNTYHYAFNENGPVCSFARERVLRVNKKPTWKYFVHEGIVPSELHGKVNSNYATTWAMNHMRSEDDLKVDRSRNLNLFKDREDQLDSRMIFYYGKELFEAGMIADAIEKLKLAITKKDLELHDRVLGIQYLCMSLMRQSEVSPNYYQQVKSFAYQGLLLFPNRAEFHCFLGDAAIKTGQLADAIPAYSAAKSCKNTNQSGGVASPLFSYEEVYTTYPRVQLARVYANLGDLDTALKEAKECEELFPGRAETALIIKELNAAKEKADIPIGSEKTDDIVFTCPPLKLYEWDYDVYKEKGIGGSETALVEMAHQMRQLTGRRVIVFHTREKDKICHGVEYYSNIKTHEYFSKYEPSLHIAWRHNLKVTNAKTYLWSHDLIPHLVNLTDRYEKVLCLSNFHKEYLHAMTGVPLDKIAVTRNGIDPDRYRDKQAIKEPGKVIYSSSPDRGLDCAMRVMDYVVKEVPHAKLHVYYGFDNMEKMGMTGEVKYFKSMIAERPYVVLHGNLSQSKLTDEFLSAETWLYPTYFMETYCITAIEALCAQVYSVTREYGALKDTLKSASDAGMATLLSHGCETEEEIEAYANEVIDALLEQKWKRVKINIEDYSWKDLAKEWLTQLK